jgi:DNA-binding Lrp family transcriptional regulator
MKDKELRLVSELFRNSRRSHRELAHVLGVSQPTVSRLIGKLEKAGVVKEYTIVADLRKLGIEIVAFTFGVWSPDKIKGYSEDERVEKAKSFLSKYPNVVLASSGQGLGMGRMMVSVHKDYSDYVEFMREARSEWADLVRLESFIMNLATEMVPFPFSLRNLGRYIEEPV